MVTIPVKNERAIFRFNAISDKRMSLIHIVNALRCITIT